MPWVEIDAFEEYVRSETGGLDSTTRVMLQAAYDAAEMQLKLDCGRTFDVAGATASARVFAPYRCSDVLYIDDATEITAVSNYGTTVASTGYQLEPLNGLGPAGDTRPYYLIRLLDGATWTSSGGRATATITGKWGWVATPAALIEAVKILGKDVAGNRDFRNGIAAVTEVAGVRARDNVFVQKVIAQYRSHKTVMVG